MKKARMNISHSRFILSKLKIFGEIVTTIVKSLWLNMLGFLTKKASLPSAIYLQPKTHGKV